ncbi:multiple coagulation factor deficiency protein 2 homolog isoform X5 [Topomyia yanbarensis]|uniref:multiple coagulation factor deficiency protein 2 homolog isoform X5 n=1 Tax=Topomyia yanbarensis TaxID=2498891 RepID=UPI00273BD64F|nr:multiple coagulation factor deficiency protein 2 homolog isoform X5 [Topomyia yanbarensis]XP_058839938.1 multiple coagulation factor deficiency protein 2 homolog isoform X5 [Topomyia yanbarensis]
MKQLALTLILFAVVAFGQRVVPGVNPNQYQQQQGQYHQPPPPQYNNQQPPHQQQQHYQQQQQPQYQQQQVPVQPQYQQHQQQAPVQHQQQQQQQHHPGQAQHHGQPQQVLNTNNIQHEKQHIAEHMDVPIDTSKMSEQELQFHYFKMHDADNNNKLDGCELIKSLIHWHDDKTTGKKSSVIHYTDDDLESIVDSVLNLMDANQDGYVDYLEYRLSDVHANRNDDYPQGRP